MKQIILLFLVVIFFVLLTLLVAKTKSAQTPLQTQNQTTSRFSSKGSLAETNAEPLAQVTYGKNGFSPAVIKLGITTRGRVVFVNAGSQDVDVESDPHPLHVSYFPLNLGIIKPNEQNKIVVFDKAGTYKYHNHLNPEQKGTIEVLK